MAEGKGPTMKSDPPPSCEDCVFWREGTQSHDEYRWGYCHRYPPSVAGDENEALVHVQTFLPDWCGEHIHKVQ